MTRYAVYAVPGLLGENDDPVAVGLRNTVEAWFARPEFRDLTVDARRYGFHATLKAPFRLVDGHGEADLRVAADAFAASRPAVLLPALRPADLGRFRALRPHGDESAIRMLADEAVRSFDAFRAGPDDSDIRRRRPETLSQRQRELFEQWGYPYVFDEFRFHLTLTDRIPPARRSEVDQALGAHFADFGPSADSDVELRSIALFVEREPGAPFEVLSVHPFAAPSADTDLQETV
jgi:hypothetical protein